MLRFSTSIPFFGTNMNLVSAIGRSKFEIPSRFQRLWEEKTKTILNNLTDFDFCRNSKKINVDSWNFHLMSTQAFSIHHKISKYLNLSCWDIYRHMQFLIIIILLKLIYIKKFCWIEKLITVIQGFS